MDRQILQLEEVNYPGFEIPVIWTLPKSDYNVTLYLSGYNKHSGNNYSGVTLSAITSAQYPLKRQNQIGSEYNYGTSLNKQDLPQEGYYFGYIEATQNNVPIDKINIVIKLKTPELGYTSRVNSEAGFLSYSELLETQYARNFEVPFPVQEKNGKLTFELFSGPALPIVIKDKQTGGSLPLGAYLKVFKVKDGREVSFETPNKTLLLSLPLAQTDNSGKPVGFKNLNKALTNGPASYTYIQNLPNGDYYALAYYGSEPISDPIPFTFPLTNC
jgi:hypothetical protein